MTRQYTCAVLLSLLCGLCSVEAADVVGQVLSLDTPDQWLLSADPGDAGRQEKWWDGPRPDAKPARVPGTMQETLGEYHGVAWYWRTLSIPANPHANGRYILRFWSIDYYIEVWVNGRAVGHHECADSMVEFDITPAVQPDAENLVAVRIVNPSNTPIDGMVIRECPGRNRIDPWAPGACYNNGGLIDSVELLIAPAVRIESLYVRPDYKRGVIEASVNVRNATAQPVTGDLALSVAPSVGGETLDLTTTPNTFAPGDTLVQARVQVRDFRLWDLNDPVLYRVTARVNNAANPSIDEKSVQCGFRDFRFEDGYFRLNGKRIFLKSAHFGGDAPMTCVVPLQPGLLRKDFLSMKAMGFNMARCIAGLGKRYMMDLADEIGFLVYDESYAAWLVTPSPYMAERWDNTVAGMIRRDRNHPSVVIWGLLNETSSGPVFMHAFGALELVKRLDDTRVVMLNSGRFDGLLVEHPEQASQMLPEAWVPGPAFQVPLVACNRSDADINHDGTIFPAAAVAMHVGAAGEPAVLRFTSPGNGEYRIQSRFQGIAGPPANGPITTGAVAVLAGGQTVFSDQINCAGRPNETAYAAVLTLQQGDVIDFVAGSGDKSFNSDTTRVDVSIVGPADATYDAARDWSITRQNPNGVWGYGHLPAGAMDSLKFVPFTQTFDGVRKSVGGLSNPGSDVWEDVLADKHPYQACPHTASIIHTLRTIDGGGRPLFVSEYGFGSANNLMHLLGHYSQATVDYAFDRKFLDEYFQKFSDDWDRWKLADTFGNMENYSRQCIAMEAGGRLLGTSAIRSNPQIISHSLTACHDTVLAAEGLITSFREPKPGVHDAMSDAWSPLRFCVFVEPVQVVRGGNARVEVVLVNEDVLKPSKYPVRIQVWGPQDSRPLDTSIVVEIPEETARPEPPFAKLVFSQDVLIDGPAGCYKCFAFFENGAAAEGGEYTFWVDDPATMPQVANVVTLWGDDPGLARWLEHKGIATRSLQAETDPQEVILVGNVAGAEYAELTRHISAGARAVFLCPAVFAQGDQPTALLPLENKGRLSIMNDWLYQNNDWAKAHPVFNGLPTGLLDYQFYREILGDKFFSGQDPPAEIVAGMINTSYGYSSGLTVCVHRIGAGHLLLNSLLVRENLSLESSHPVAERLLRNMLNYAPTGAPLPTPAPAPAPSKTP
ncbi:MAG: glycoside hydrolase family 2 protein [Pirellulaceae bacterium]